MIKKADTAKKKSFIPVISFFTGGGFLDIGFEKAGFNPVWTNEVNPVFAQFYSFGMKHWRRSVSRKSTGISISRVCSIERLFASQILREAFPEGKPSFFGIIGGPPCPDFSNGGKNMGGKGVNGRLSETFVNRIVKIKPDFFVFENVSGLYKTKKHREFLAALELKLENNNYYIDINILNALESGVPQNRERLFIVGILNKHLTKCADERINAGDRGWFPWPGKKKYKDALTKFNWPGIVVNGKSPNLPDNVPLELTVFSVFDPQNCPSKIQNGTDTFKTYSDKFSKIKEGDTKRKSFKKLHRYRFSPTACYGNNEVHLHPWLERRLSVREAMRIQGIPDSYVLPEDAPLSHKFAVVSNGVPVPLSYEVAKSLKKFLDKGGIIKTK